MRPGQPNQPRVKHPKLILPMVVTFSFLNLNRFEEKPLNLKTHAPYGRFHLVSNRDDKTAPTVLSSLFATFRAPYGRFISLPEVKTGNKTTAPTNLGLNS